MGKLRAGHPSSASVFYQTPEREWSVRDVEELKSSFSFEGLPPRSLILARGFSPLKLWALVLAAWEHELSVLPLGRDRDSSLPDIPWSCLLDDTDEGLETLVRSSSAQHESDLYILTSGSTGSPKAIGHSLKGVASSAKATLDFYHYEVGDTWLLSLDPSHIGGFQILLRSWIGGGSVFYGAAPKDVSGVMRDRAFDFVSLVPSQLYSLIAEGDHDMILRLQKMKAILLGGAKTQESLLTSIKKLKLPASITYGSSETASQIAGFQPGQYPNQPEEVGEILSHWTLHERKEGLYLEGSSLLLGYYQDGLWNKVESPFLLPDKGYKHGDKLFIEGRADSIFQSGGENVSPAEIVRALEHHFQSSHLLVLKKPHDRLGAIPLLVIRAKDRPRLDLVLSDLERLKPMHRPREIWWYQSDDVVKLSAHVVENLLLSSSSTLSLLWSYEKI